MRLRIQLTIKSRISATIDQKPVTSRGRSQGLGPGGSMSAGCPTAEIGVGGGGEVGVGPGPKYDTGLDAFNSLAKAMVCAAHSGSSPRSL